MARRARPRHLELRVVFDTSALHTESESFLFRKELADLVKQYKASSDLQVRWFIPAIVKDERLFQMMEAATKLLPSLQKLERVLGHNLNITKAIIDSRIPIAIQKQVEEYGITIQPLSCAVVDWPRLMQDSVFRRPPFQLGDKEKGFRDAVILETFLQVVSDSPSSRSTARVVLVAGDQLLRTAAEARVGSHSNIHILDSIEALKGLINTLGSEIDEAFINNIKDRARKLFFIPDDEGTLYYKAGIGRSLNTVLQEAKMQLPNNAERYTVEKWTINAPEFVRKQGQRIYWTTRFQAKLKAVKKPRAQEWAKASDTFLSSGMLTISRPLFPLPPELPANLGTSLTAPLEDELVAYGVAHTDVLWSLAVATSTALTKPKVEEVTFVEVIWD